MNLKKILFPCLVLCFFFLTTKFSLALDKKKSAEEIYEAVQFQDLDKLKQLLSKGANANSLHGGRPLLGWAAQNGNLEIVQALIDAKADVNKGDEGSVGHTPLMRAIDTQQTAIVQTLLNAKANPNAKTPDGETCLDMAVKSRKLEIVSSLIKAGADVKYVTKDGDSPALTAAQDAMPESFEIIKILGEAKANLDASNAAYTPLSYAISQSNKELVQALLAAGANPNAKTSNGSAPIHGALDNKEILEILLQAKADPNAQDSSGDTPLINAVRYDNIEAVKTLLNAKADVNKKDQYGNTPLEVAQQNYKTEIVALLAPNNSDTTDTTKANNKDQALQEIPVNFGGSKCTIVDAAKKQMEIHGLLQKQVDAGKMDSEIFRTFGEDTKEYGELLTSDPNKACDLLERLRMKYGV